MAIFGVLCVGVFHLLDTSHLTGLYSYASARSLMLLTLVAFVITNVIMFSYMKKENRIWKKIMEWDRK